VKMDVVPGRYNTTWFRAKVPEGVGQDGTDTYDLYCAEYCGEGHSTMLTRVVVHKPGHFETWLAETAAVQQNMPAGQRLYRQYGCAGCHSTDGTEKIGPSFKGIWGETHQFTDGTSAVVDDNYVRQSILYPSVKIVRGYEDKMSQYIGKIKDEDITEIIEFIKSLK
jgi:cytochrome c oxidase subunit 2